MTSIAAPVAHAQSVVDVESPIIELEEQTDGVAGETQVFTALVVDNQALKDVKIYHRFAGQIPFTSLNMTPLANTEYFTARIPTSRSETRNLEYYIQARDEGGNRVVQGYAFDPLIRQLNPPTVPSITKSQPTDSGGVVSDGKSGFKWWYVVLGVLAAGAIAAAAGGSDNPQSSNTQVPITVTVTQPIP